MKMPSGANCLPDGDFLLLAILIFPMQCAFGSKGFASAEAKPLPLMAQSTPPQSHSR